jgi:predicted  nucleic acid-binding Zn-ribbon protein
MLPAKRLLAWHQAKEALRAAQEEQKRLEEAMTAAERRVAEKEEQLRRMPAPTNPDEEIARMLLEQECWLAKKERDDAVAAYADKNGERERTIQQLQFEIMQLEAGLDPEFLGAYIRLSETKAQPIAEVRNKCCMGCCLPLSLRKLEEWRRGKGPVFCDECDRILV